MANKTISLPDDVLPVIDTLGMPFSQWVAEQLRRHSAASTMSFGEQLLADAALAQGTQPSAEQLAEIGRRMGESAPW